MRRTLLLLLALAGPVGSAAAAPVEVGHVVGVDGFATATGPDGASRTLVCGDAVHDGERLDTAPGSRLVVAHDGRHVHLGPVSRLEIRDDGVGEGLAALEGGDVRVLDTRERPVSLIATPAGPIRTDAVDFEVHRLTDGSLQICDWSDAARGRCRRVDPVGRMRPTVEEGPRIDLAIGDLCPWRGRDGLRLADFGNTPPVAAPPATGFEPEFDPGEPGCQGDECTPSLEIPDPDVEWTVAPPTVFLP